MTPPNPKKIRLLGVPMDLGAGRRGVDMGPSAVRYAGIDRIVRELGFEFEDGGDIGVPIPEVRQPGSGPRYMREIQRVCERLAQRTKRILEDGAMPLVMGGDHSIAMGTVAGVAAHYREQGDRIGLLWVDAHADMNVPETSPSGNIHGMPLAALLGYGAPELVNIGGFTPKVPAENTVLLGIRQVDSGEREIVLRSGVTYFEMMKIDARGMGPVVQEALDVVTRGTAGFHVSFDVDGIDPDFAPGVGTPVTGGLSLREAHLLMECIADSGAMTSLEVTEVNPIHDSKNMTAKLVCELVASALGKKVMGPLHEMSRAPAPR